MTNNPNQNTTPSQKTPGSSPEYQGGNDQSNKQSNKQGTAQPGSDKQPKNPSGNY